MVTEERMLELENALRETQARVEALGALQVAMTIAVEDSIEDFDQRVDRALQMMRKQAADDGRFMEAAVINGLIKQLHEQLGLPAND